MTHVSHGCCCQLSCRRHPLTERVNFLTEKGKGLIKVEANRGGDALRGALLLAAGTLAFVGFAACVGLLQQAKSNVRPPAPGNGLKTARRELRFLAR
jgi:hypothetical protein